MNTEPQHMQDNKQQQQSTQNTEGGEQVKISQPHIDRPEGPFEHSGETSGWTKEEAEEKEQQEDSQQQ
ncbi:MAG TPA: hypothetical protein VGN63_05165 [Flavisolibacter sp.]|jgi:hypothetical protein|nr:hypothetical protein [Flavisolibacter sp.]